MECIDILFNTVLCSVVQYSAEHFSAVYEEDSVSLKPLYDTILSGQLSVLGTSEF